jgi:hypothetical protein
MSAGNFFGGQFFGGGFFGSITPTVVIDTHDGPERKRVEEFKRSKEQLRADLEGAWQAITEHPEPAVVMEAVQIAKPAMSKAARKIVADKPVGKPNFDILSQFRLRQLMQLHQDLQDEEEILLFMDDA